MSSSYPAIERAGTTADGVLPSDAAVQQVRDLHGRWADAVDAAERRRSLRARLARGWRRARRQGRRLERYPAAFLHGFLRPDKARVVGIDRTYLSTLTDAGRHDEAVLYASALMEVHTADAPFMTRARRAFAKAGVLELQLEATRRQRAVAESPQLAALEERLRGRLTELDRTWWPSVRVDVARPRPGRVLHLLKASMPYRQSGYTMRSQYTIEGQRDAGLAPVAVTALGFPEGEADIPLIDELNGTTYHRLPDVDGAIRGPSDAYLQAYADAVAERVAEIAPEVIHVHSGHRGYEAAMVAIAVGRAADLPVVYEVRGFFESLWSSDTGWNERTPLYHQRHARETQCMHEAAAVVTLSESMKADIVARGIPRDKVIVVPNGVNTDVFYPKPRSQSLVDEWGLAGRFVFGYVSNLDHFREGHEYLIRAAVALREAGVPATAMLIGDGGRRAELEQLVQSEGAEDVVIFTGRVPHDRVLDYYRLLDVFVVPRVDERAARLVTPLKPFEAMAAGVPVIVSDLPALTEIIGDGRRGRSFPVGDAGALATLLGEFAADAELREAYAQRGREWVVAERQWALNGQRYAEIYANVIQGD